MAEFKQELGEAVNELYLTVRSKNLPTAPMLRSLFGAVAHITDLTLLLPSATPPSIFLHVHFLQLEFLRTNLPHGHLDAFLSRHKRMSTVLLGHCGSAASECPASRGDLDHITVLECPLECARTLVHPKVNRLSVDIRSPNTNVPDVLQAFPANKVEYVTLEHRPYDRNLLASVKVAFPFVSSLKLCETSYAVSDTVILSHPWLTLYTAPAWCRPNGETRIQCIPQMVPWTTEPPEADKHCCADLRDTRKAQAR